MVQRSDGTPYEGFLNRQIAIQTIYEGSNPRSVNEDKMVVPDDSVVRYTIQPEEGDTKIKITVSNRANKGFGLLARAAKSSEKRVVH